MQIIYKSEIVSEQNTIQTGNQTGTKTKVKRIHEYTSQSHTLLTECMGALYVTFYL